MSEVIYRVQHKDDGRGPYRPGFSMKWSDPWPHPYDFKSWMEEFGLGLLRGVKKNEHLGCGCRSLDMIHKWFSDNELARLYLFGYRIVRLDADRILAESPAQVVFARRRPFNMGARIEQEITA